MKKKFMTFIIIFIIFLIGFIIVLNVRKSDDDEKVTKVKLAEVTHSVFYAPLYAAIELGYFKDEGIDLEVILTPGADKVSAAVLSNSVDIGFSGPEAALYIYDGGEKDYLVTFAGLTKRDGQFIISRDCKKDFKLEDLYGKEILVGRKGGMPALNFLNALKNSNIDEEKININYAIDFANLSGTFLSGIGDYVNLFEPTATKMMENGDFCIVDSIGKLSGEVPYTAFYARKSYLNNNEEMLKKFTRAINKGLEYVKENDEKAVAKTILPQFPDTSQKELEAMIKNYKEYDSWLENTFITEKSFDNLYDLLKDNDLVKKDMPYDKLIDNLYEQ